MAPLSPRSLASLDRIQEAADVIAKHHVNRNVSSLLVHFETEEIANTMKAEQEAHASTSYADVLKTEDCRNHKRNSKTLIFAYLQVWNLIWAVAAAACVERLGRRPLFLTSAATMLASHIVITGLSDSFANTGNSALGVAVNPLLFVFFPGYGITLTPLFNAYPIEIWSC
ncbi:hypothetical protein FAVG1_11874 [Fusarium avenaceum]|nr:hypothetical protein FAVG1_11874 [Fusarium avenaceum]